MRRAALRYLPVLCGVLAMALSSSCTSLNPLSGNGSQTGNGVTTVRLLTTQPDVVYQTEAEKNAYVSPVKKWTQLPLNSALAERGNANLITFNNMLWVIGGSNWHWMNSLSGPSKTDVWQSADGVSWTQVADSLPWGPRLNYAVVVFQNKLWVLGGRYEDTTISNDNDVWNSVDGIHWTLVTAKAPWSSRGLRNNCVAHNGRMWVIGCADPAYAMKTGDVWSSADGVTWERTASSGFPARNFPGCLSYQGKLWVIGGSTAIDEQLFDVWNSTDGRQWRQAGYSTIWNAREGLSTIVYDDKMWVIGGSNLSGSTLHYFNDVWFSVNGVEWNEVQADSVHDAALQIIASWPGRERLTCTVFGGAIYAGFGEWYKGFRNDMWKFECK